MNCETSAEIEIVVANWFNARLNIIVPNVSWGLNLPFECDLAIATKANYLNEVEIKVSRSDLIRDNKKRKWAYHDGYRIRKLWFAIPEKLRESIGDIPIKAGVLIVSRDGNITQARRPQTDTHARRLSDNERCHLAHLGAMRIWDLKRALLQKK